MSPQQLSDNNLCEIHRLVIEIEKINVIVQRVADKQSVAGLFCTCTVKKKEKKSY